MLYALFHPEPSAKAPSLTETANQQEILLREQPFRVIRVLIAGEGKIVTRDAIKKQFWPNDTMPDFYHSINVPIRILRQAPGDSADNPKYIETLARQAELSNSDLDAPIELNSLFPAYPRGLAYPKTVSEPLEGRRS
jgi:hypothetical protein